MHHEQWMTQALALARRAGAAGEIPVGAVVVRNGILLGEGWNGSITHHDPTAHAEINALRAAAQASANYRLGDAILYSTLEPCPMCAGAMVHARIARVVFGAYDPRSGAVASRFDLLQSASLNHRVAWEAGVMQEQCVALLQTFFRERRLRLDLEHDHEQK